MKVFKITNKNAGMLNNLNGSNHGTVLFFHPQCSHCNMLKPEWEKMKDALRTRKQNCNLYEVNGEHMDHINHPMKQVVDGFPTILNVNNGKINTFEKERNVNNMIDFILKNISHNSGLVPNNDIRNAEKRLTRRKVSFNLNHGNLIKKRGILNAKNMKNTVKLHNAKKKRRRSRGKSKERSKEKPKKRKKGKKGGTRRNISYKNK